MQPRAEPGAEHVRSADRLRRSGRMADAEEHYLRALEDDPECVRAHVGLQTLATLQGQDLDLRRKYRAQGNTFLRARLEPSGEEQTDGYAQADEPWRSLGLGIATRSAGARELDPGHAWPRIALARLYLAEGKLGAAEREFLAAHWSEPEHPTPPSGLSVIADRRGDLWAAYRWARAAYVRAPSEESLVARVHSLAVRSRSKRAMRNTAELLLRAAPEGDGSAALHAGELFARAGEPKRATQAWELAEAGGITKVELEVAEAVTLDVPLAPFVEAFTRGMRARYRHYAAAGEAEDYEECLAWAYELFERTMGRKLGEPGETLKFAFVGRLQDPTSQTHDPLVLACAEAGLLLVFGQRSGGPPEALLAEIVRRGPMEKLHLRGTETERERVWTRRRQQAGYAEWAGGGDLAGLALARIVVLDADAVARWRGGIERRRATLAPYRDRILSAAALEDEPVTDVDDPAGVADRLYLVSEGISLEAEVEIHEDAHLVDAELHLPVGKHAIRNLGLVFKRGFSATEILAFLERNAQLTAIAEGPDPLAALATCCAALGHVGTHASGYREVVQAIVHEIHDHPERYEEVDARRVILQQFHRLPPEKVRSSARIVMRDWGLEHGETESK